LSTPLRISWIGDTTVFFLCFRSCTHGIRTRDIQVAWLLDTASDN
jgi:hypothetical protein